MKTKCRICSGSTLRQGYLYICQKKLCNSFFWHSKVLERFKSKLKAGDIENKDIEKELLRESRVPERIKGFSVYVILLPIEKGEKKSSVYVGSTSHHPKRRYLQHLRKYRSGNILKKIKPRAMLKTEMGFETRKIAEKREEELAEELESRYKVYFGV